MVAEALTSLLLEKLATAAIDQVGRVLGVQSDLRKLESALSAIQAVILAAEERSVTERDVRDWVAKLKDAAYDADDLLDEFQTYGEWRNQHTSMSNKVRNFFSPRSNPLAFRIKMSSEIKAIVEKLDIIALERTRYQLRVDPPCETRHHQMEPRMTAAAINETNIYGRDADVEEILKLLLEEETHKGEDLSIVTIAGLGGLGKTTLAQLVYKHERVVKEKFDKMIWVCVSDPFDINRIAKTIIESIEGRCDLMELAPAVDRIQHILANKRFLLVLDDVWTENEQEWEKLKDFLSVGDKGSKILVTTRSAKTATIMATTSPYYLGVLSEDDCWRLFEKRAFTRTEYVQRDQTLEAIGREILAKCGGSPLAAKSMGSLMRFKTGRREWLAVRDSDIWRSTDEGNQVMTSLRLSYNHLSPHLKQCFAYCSIFPKNTIIKRDELVLHWIALGFIPSNTILESSLNKGNEYFNHLVWISFLDKCANTHGVPQYYRMHDLVHDLAKSVAGDENFICYADQKATNIPPRCRFCTLVGSWNEPELKHLFRESSKVRALRLVVVGSNIINSSILFTTLTRLRVLDMRDCPPIKEVHASIKRLQHLRYFKFDGSHDISELPNSIGRLRNLQTLDFSHFYRFGSLPESIGKLANLRTLQLTYCVALHSLPQSLGNLSNLEEIDLGGCSGVAELPESIGRLANLRTLQLLRCKALHSLPRSLGNLSNLEKLNLSECNDIVELPESIGKLVNLRTLYLSGCEALHSLPQSLGNLSNLEELDLHDCKGIIELPESIGKLANLKTLQLSWCQSMCSLPQSLGNFSNLEKLNLSGCKGIVELSESIGKLANLRTLQLSRCEALHSLPQSLGNFSNLEKLNLSGCNGIVELPESIGKLANLRTLNLSCCEALHSLPQSLGNLSNLEELDLHDCKGIIELPESIGKLTNLRTLQLAYCEALQMLPQSFSNLANLEGLGLDSCKGITELPEGMGNMANLRHLKNTGMSSLRGMPLDIGKMRSLVTLQLFVVGEGSNHSSIAEMQHLNLIEGELKLTHLENVKRSGDAAIANMKEKHRLKGLDLSWSDLIPYDPYSIHEEVLADLIPHPNLEKLHIVGYPGINFSNWLRMMSTSIPNLVELRLYGLKCIPPFSGGLLQLKELYLSNMPYLEGWLTVADGVELYPRLIVLRITNCPKMHAEPCIPAMVKELHLVGDVNYELLITTGRAAEGVDLQDVSDAAREKLFIHHSSEMVDLPEGIRRFTSVRSLFIFFCPSLARIPEWLRELTSLEELTIVGCKPSLEERCKKDTGEDWPIIAHIPLIAINGWV